MRRQLVGGLCTFLVRVAVALVVIVEQYVQTDLEADRQVANTLGELIIGGSLASTEITSEPRED
jgi:hypothetical protein